MVNWRRVQKPKWLGGLGIKELQCFNRALRLRWLWYKWTAPHKPWTGMHIKVTEAEQQLFRTCTNIQIGDGNQALFWHDNWLNGRSPRDIAPDCYRLAWRKNRTVATTLTRRKWMRGLGECTQIPSFDNSPTSCQSYSTSTST